MFATYYGIRSNLGIIGQFQGILDTRYVHRGSSQSWGYILANHQMVRPRPMVAVIELPLRGMIAGLLRRRDLSTVRLNVEFTETHWNGNDDLMYILNT